MTNNASIKEGDTVAIDYEGRFEDGTVFDSSHRDGHSHPLIFIVGKHEVISGFERGVVGLCEGDEKKITIAPADAYGMPNDRLVRAMPRSEITLPNGQEPRAGMTLVTYTPEGHPVHIIIKEVTKEQLVLDMNHPLAGKTLVFTMRVAGINESVKTLPSHH